MQNFTLITWCLRPENALKSASKVDLLSPARHVLGKERVKEHTI